MIHTVDLTKTVLAGEEQITILQDIQLHVQKGEFVAVMGPSGSGKSTLLQLLGGLDKPTEGEIHFNGVALNDLSEKEKTLFRRRNIGFIFQSYQLLPTLTVEENISFPLDADNVSRPEVRSRVKQLVKDMGLEGKETMFPNVLSGGQQQRVAIARALSTQPKVILADEPTGNLDRKKGTDILDLLSNMHKEEKHTIVMVTHDIFAAGYADRVIMLKDGRIESQVTGEERDKDDIMAHFLAQLDA